MLWLRLALSCGSSLLVLGISGRAKPSQRRDCGRGREAEEGFVVCLTLACCWRLFPAQVRGQCGAWWSAAHCCPPWVSPSGSALEGSVGCLVGLGWAGLAAWPGVTEHSSWGRDKSQGQGQVPGPASPKAEPGCERYLRESCEGWTVPQCAWIVSGCAVTKSPSRSHLLSSAE